MRIRSNHKVPMGNANSRQSQHQHHNTNQLNPKRHIFYNDAWASRRAIDCAILPSVIPRARHHRAIASPNPIFQRPSPSPACRPVYGRSGHARARRNSLISNKIRSRLMSTTTPTVVVSRGLLCAGEAHRVFYGGSCAHLHLRYSARKNFPS